VGLAARRRAWLTRATRAVVLIATVTTTLPARAQELSLDLRSRGLQPGDAVVVTITVPPASAALTVTAFAARWPVYKVDDTRWRALVGIDLDRKPGPYEVVVTAGGPHPLTARKAFTVAPKRFPRRVLTVSPDYVNPPPEQLARIAADTEFQKTVYAHSASEPAWRSGLIRPVAETANSSFGTRSVFNGEARSPHSGTDFLSPPGTPIHAPAAGRVLGARDLFFTGNTVIIDHGLGVFSMLAHMSRIDVHEGQAIAQGDIVGLVGATGRVTGSHLHWALRVGTARIDPLSVLSLFDTDQ
jgi:murein DD-endopeptidase MepM/ murein hydrolase activator NlpD